MRLIGGPVAPVQEIASLKRQFTELLSDIGFVREGLRARVIERASSMGTDGVLEATGSEVSLELTGAHTPRTPHTPYPTKCQMHGIKSF